MSHEVKTDGGDIETGQQKKFQYSTMQKRKIVEVGVGAGAQIKQDLITDSLELKDWEEKPNSVMRLYFVFVNQFKEIKEKGIKNLIGKTEGYLDGLSVG